MTQQRQVYQCGVCGNAVEMLAAGGGELTCCGTKMLLLTEKSGQEGKEKHIPVVEQAAGGVRVKVGAVPHPMQSDHYIEWVEISGPNQVLRKHLKPEDTPEACFNVPMEGLQVRAYCNKHGLWKA